MALRDTLAKRAAPALEPGEQIQAVFVGQTMSQWWALAGVLPFLLKNRYHAVVATDRRIALLVGNGLMVSSPKTLVASLPRATRLGPASGLWHTLEIGGVKLHVHKRFHKDIAAADAAMGA